MLMIQREQNKKTIIKLSSKQKLSISLQVYQEGKK